MAEDFRLGDRLRQAAGEASGHHRDGALIRAVAVERRRRRRVVTSVAAATTVVALAYGASVIGGTGQVVEPAGPPSPGPSDSWPTPSGTGSPVTGKAADERSRRGPNQPSLTPASLLTAGQMPRIFRHLSWRTVGTAPVAPAYAGIERFTCLRSPWPGGDAVARQSRSFRMPSLDDPAETEAVGYQTVQEFGSVSAARDAMDRIRGWLADCVPRIKARGGFEPRVRTLARPALGDDAQISELVNGRTDSDGLGGFAEGDRVFFARKANRVVLVRLNRGGQDAEDQTLPAFRATLAAAVDRL